MQIKLINRIGCELIPLNNTFAIHMLSEDYPMIVEDESKTSYQTSIVKFYEYQGTRLIVRTDKNSRFEFEVIN